MKLTIFAFLITLLLPAISQNRDSTIVNEFQKIKQIPTSSRPNAFGEKKPLLNFDSAFTRIVAMGVPAIPTLIKLLTDTTIVSIVNPCFPDESCRKHDIAWYLINEIEPFPRYTALHIQFCTFNDCDYFPDGFFTFVHSDPKKIANRYKKYFYSAARTKYLKSQKS